MIPSPNVVPPADSYALPGQPDRRAHHRSDRRYLKANKLDKIGMVAATDASGEVGVASARKVFGEQKIDLKLARIDLRATDASTQLASVAGSDVKLVYSSYSGAGAITVVKSFKNLGLQQPLIVSYGNISEAFVAARQGREAAAPARHQRRRRSCPTLLTDPGERERSQGVPRRVREALSGARRHDQPARQGGGRRRRGDPAQRQDPTDFAAVKKFLESTPIESVQNQRFSPTNHVGLDASAVIIVELKDDGWVKADADRRVRRRLMNLFTQAVISGLMTGAVYTFLGIGLVLVYRTARILNLAHGETFAITGVAAALLIGKAGLPLLAALGARRAASPCFLASACTASSCGRAAIGRPAP